MKRNLALAGLVVAMVCLANLLSSQAYAATCSTASVAGNWAYTYNGTVFVPSPLPAAAVGRAHLDVSGNLSGSQTHTLAGQTEVEDVSGTYTVNRDCTGSMTVNVSLNGVLLRTATVNVVYDTNMNHARMIFTSLVLAGGINLPAAVTLDASRITTSN